MLTWSFLDKLNLEKAKTKEISEILKKLPNQGKSSLIALPELDKNIILASRNLPKVKSIQAKDLNALDLLSFQCLIMPKDSIKIIQETFQYEAPNINKKEEVKS